MAFSKERPQYPLVEKLDFVYSYTCGFSFSVCFQKSKANVYLASTSQSIRRVSLIEPPSKQDISFSGRHLLSKIMFFLGDIFNITKSFILRFQRCKMALLQTSGCVVCPVIDFRAYIKRLTLPIHLQSPVGVFCLKELLHSGSFHVTFFSDQFLKALNQSVHI